MRHCDGVDAADIGRRAVGVPPHASGRKPARRVTPGLRRWRRAVTRACPCTAGRRWRGRPLRRCCRRLMRGRGATSRPTCAPSPPWREARPCTRSALGLRFFESPKNKVGALATAALLRTPRATLASDTAPLFCMPAEHMLDRTSEQLLRPAQVHARRRDAGEADAAPFR